MKGETLFIIKLWMLLFFVNAVAVGQDAEQTYNMAIKEYQRGNLESSRSLLTRLNYFDTAHVFSVSSYLILGDIEEINKQYYAALSNYKEALRYNLDTLKKPFIIFKIMACYVNIGDYNSAKEFLNYSCIDTTHVSYLAISSILGVWEGNYDLSKKYYLKAFGSISKEIKHEFDQIEKIESRNINKAKILNAIAPGSGMWYLGSKKDALNSPILISSLAGLFIYYGNIYGWLNSLVTFSPWMGRYYSAGITRVENLKKDLIHQHCLSITKNIVSSYPKNNKLKLKMN